MKSEDACLLDCGTSVRWRSPVRGIKSHSRQNEQHWCSIFANGKINSRRDCAKYYSEMGAARGVNVKNGTFVTRNKTSQRIEVLKISRLKRDTSRFSVKTSPMDINEWRKPTVDTQFEQQETPPLREKYTGNPQWGKIFVQVVRQPAVKYETGAVETTRS